jgi:hypothetical protein
LSPTVAGLICDASAGWFWYAAVAAILYGAHQILTRLAAEQIGDGLAGFVVEASAALSMLNPDHRHYASTTG